MVRLLLSTLLGERKWAQSDLVRKTGIRANTISDLYNEFATRISLDHINRICKALDCDISDLMKLVPDDDPLPVNPRLKSPDSSKRGKTK